MADETTFDECKAQFDLTKENSAISAYVAAYKEYLAAAKCWTKVNALPKAIRSCISQYCDALENHCRPKARDCGYKAMIPDCSTFTPPSMPMVGEFYINDEGLAEETFNPILFAAPPPGIKPVPTTNPMLRYDLIFNNINYCTKTRKPETPVSTVEQCQALFNGKVPVPRFSTTGKFLGCVVPGADMNELIAAVAKAITTLNDNIKIVKDKVITPLLARQTDVKTKWENCCGICKIDPNNCPKCTENTKLCGDEPGGCPAKLPECATPSE